MSTVAAPSSFGGGLGAVIGGALGNNQLEEGQNSVNGQAGGFDATVAPYNTFGQSFLAPTSAAISNINSGAASTQSYDQFMSGYTNTPAAEYQLQQANQGQNNSAAATGNLLSGANQRALGTIDNGIVSQNANTAYNEYLQGNNQQFGQLETALGNMFSAIGVGQTATGQQAGVTSSQIGATSNIAQAEAKNDQSKGSGIGAMANGLTSAFAAF